MRLAHGADILYLETDCPEGCWPYEGKATLEMRIARGQGEEYCRQNLPEIPLEVSNYSHS